MARDEKEAAASAPRPLTAYLEDVQRALAASEARFHGLVGSRSEAVVLLDARGEVVFATHAMGRLLRSPPRELVGTPFERYAHPDDRAPLRALLELSRLGPGELHGDVRLAGADGEWRAFQLFLGNRLHEPSLKVIVVSVLEQTGQRRAEELLSIVMDCVPSAILVLDERGRVARANVGAGALLGYTERELVGMALTQLVPSARQTATSVEPPRVLTRVGRMAPR